MHSCDNSVYEINTLTVVSSESDKTFVADLQSDIKCTMESLNLRSIEQAKISCAKKLFNEISTNNVRYHDVDSYQSLLNIMDTLQ